MYRAIRYFIGGVLLLGLSSCGHKEAPETVTQQRSAPQVKLQTQAPAPIAAPLPPQLAEPQAHKVGLLVPLSGPHASLGKGLRDAAEMALFENGSTPVTLIPQDTAQGARGAALKVLDQGAELLLGPVFGSEVEAVKPLASARHVNLISFSTDQNIAGNGTFILGFLPSQQIERVTSFAKERGLTKLVAFTPDDQYGHLIDASLKRLDSQGKIQLLGTIHYSKGDLLEGNPGNVRISEEIASYKTKGIEALLIPEGGENLTLLLHLLGSQKPLKILGSGQWDTPETLQHTSSLEGGFFASTNQEARQNFKKRFEEAYGYTPPRISTLAYDAMALSIVLAEKGYTPQNLTFSQGFSGVDGLFRLTPQGLNERALAVIEVSSSGFKTVSPASQIF